MSKKPKAPLSAADLAALKREMYSQVPLVRSQIRSLRAQAEASAALVDNAADPDRLGHVLTSVMLAGFTLELGLKMFVMTYGNARPHGHDLKLLYDGFEQQIRDDIGASYTASKFPKPPITVFALSSGPTLPEVPSGVPLSRYDTAENVIISSARAFERARYFFEGVKGPAWATIDHAVHYMLALSHVLDVVYDGYAEAGGWGAVDRPLSG